MSHKATELASVTSQSGSHKQMQELAAGALDTDNDAEKNSNDEDYDDEFRVIKPSIALRDDPHYRINPERYHGWFRSYVRQDWGTVNVEDGGELGELRAGWIELFFDLIFVAGIVHISSESVYALSEDNSRRRLAGASDYEGDIPTKNEEFLFCTFAQFGLLMQLWNEQVTFESRFANDQIMDEWLRFLTMAAILAMGTCIHDSQDYFQAFLFAFAMAKLFMIISYSKTSLIPRARNHCLLQIFLSGIIMIASIVCCLTVDGDSILWLEVYAVIFFFYYFSGWAVWAKKSRKYDIPIPVNVPHIAERMGLFTMLILGESIISLMTAQDLGLSVNFMLLIGAGFVIAYALGQLYFSCQPSEEKILSGNDTHAMRKGGWRARLFAVSHTVLWFSLLAFGVGIKVDSYHLENKERQPIDTMLAGYGIFLSCVALNCIRVSHPFENRTMWIWAVRIICMIIMAVVPALYKLNNALILGIMMVLVLVQVIIDEEGAENKRDTKHEVKEKVKEAVERQTTGIDTMRGTSLHSRPSSQKNKTHPSNNDSTSNTNNSSKENYAATKSQSASHEIKISGVGVEAHHAPKGLSQDDINVLGLEERESARKRHNSRQNRAHTSGTLSPQANSPHKYFKKQVSGVGSM